MYALVDIKGKQYKAEKGTVLRVDKLQNKEGDSLEFESVMFISDKDGVKIGDPYVNGVKVKATVEEHFKDKKVIVFKHKRRKNYRRTKGHRQQYTLIKVDDIIGLK